MGIHASKKKKGTIVPDEAVAATPAAQLKNLRASEAQFRQSAKASDELVAQKEMALKKVQQGR